MRKISLFILILFLSNCGYTPIYNNDYKTKIKINVLDIEGDNKINNLLITDIKKSQEMIMKKSLILILKRILLKQ